MLRQPATRSMFKRVFDMSEQEDTGTEVVAIVVTAVSAGQQAVINGFHDAGGDPVQNAELAKQRAIAVRDALVALGVPQDKVELKKPEEVMATGPANEARRVEVVVKQIRSFRSQAKGPIQSGLLHGAATLPRLAEPSWYPSGNWGLAQRFDSKLPSEV
ncbi:OmpA-like domain containing protein [Comamonadaceae bacterium]